MTGSHVAVRSWITLIPPTVYVSIVVFSMENALKGIANAKYK